MWLVTASTVRGFLKSFVLQTISGTRVVSSYAWYIFWWMSPCAPSTSPWSEAKTTMVSSLNRESRSALMTFAICWSTFLCSW